METQRSPDEGAVAPSEETDEDQSESYNSPIPANRTTTSSIGTSNENSSLEEGQYQDSPGANNKTGNSEPSVSAQEPNQNVGTELNILGPSMSQVSLLDLMFRTQRPATNGRRHPFRHTPAQSLRPSYRRTVIQLPTMLFGAAPSRPSSSSRTTTDPPNDNNANEVEPIVSSFYLRDQQMFEGQRMRRRRTYPYIEQQPRCHCRPTPTRRNTIPSLISVSEVSLFEFRRRMQLLSILTSAVALSDTAGLRSNYNKKSEGDDNK